MRTAEDDLKQTNTDVEKLFEELTQLEENAKAVQEEYEKTEMVESDSLLLSLTLPVVRGKGRRTQRVTKEIRQDKGTVFHGTQRCRGPPKQIR